MVSCCRRSWRRLSWWQASISNVLTRSNLVTRLLVLVLVAKLPAFAVLLGLQHELSLQRLDQAHDMARQQVALLDQSLDDAMIGVQGMLTAASRMEPIAALTPGCNASLDQVRQAVPLYRLLAVLRPDGTLGCSSADATLPPLLKEQLTTLANRSPGFTVGRYARLDSGDPVLLVAFVWTAVADKHAGALVAGISLSWLSHRIQQPLHRPDAGVLIADGGGTVLAYLPPAAAGIGASLPPAYGRQFAATAPGTTLVKGASRPPAAGNTELAADEDRVIGFLPPVREPYGLFLAAAFNVNDLNPGLRQAGVSGYWLLAAGAALSVVLALVGAHRYVRTPSVALLRAANAWTAGALDVRAALPRACPAEFNELGTAFNRMAETLQHQRGELQRMNDALELRVAERTGALLTSNNRLQVEIAEREQSEANLRQVQKLQAVGQLAAGIAHNFNNLLGAMLGSIELLQKRLAGSDPGQLRLLEIAKAAVSRGSWLTSQLLAFSRKQPMVAAPVDMGQAISGVEALLRSTLGLATRITVQSQPDLWAAMIDANQFDVAVLNLAVNAREAMPDGGSLVISAGNATVGTDDAWPAVPPGDYVRVDVADTGHGMTPEIAARAFEPFFTTKGSGENAGLGLSQVHGMVTQLGGAVTIDSRLGVGTRVSIMLPRSAVVPKVYGGDQPEALRPALGHDSIVLLVDDDDEVREVTAGILADAGYMVTTAADGSSALAVLELEARKVGLVIADYAMPGMTGLELLTAIRRRSPDMPMLLATGYADHQSLCGDGLESDQIVRKPFRSTELLRRIELVVERQAALAD